jgi:hypothetical protein
MRIISKFKDFYDYLAQDYDADIVYSRIPRWTGNLRLRNLYMANNSWWKNIDPTKLLHVESQVRWSNIKIGSIEPGGIVFGVYPFVYSTPILKLFGRDNDGEDAWKYPYAVYIGNSFIETLESEQDLKVRCKLISKFTLDIVKAHNKHCNSWETLDELVEYKLENYYKDKILDYLKCYARKVECPRVFETLGSPVFIEENDLIDFYHSPFPEKSKDKKTIKQYLVDLSFNALDPAIIKYWYNDLCDLNTYNYIENFLWSIKQEPQSQQTNKEKILSHGFDLKTSFRKM